MRKELADQRTANIYEIAILEQQWQALLRNASLTGLIMVGIIGILVYNQQRETQNNKNRAELENQQRKEEKLQQDLAF